MKSTNKSKTPLLVLALSVLVIALTVFLLSQRGGEVDGGFGEPAYPEVDAPERITDEEATESGDGTVGDEPIPAPLPTTDEAVEGDARDAAEEAYEETVRDE